MKPGGKLQIDSGTLEDHAGAELEVVIPYTVPQLTSVVLERAVSLTRGLNARFSLVAVHVIPYQSAYGCPTSTHAYLVSRLLELSAQCPVPLNIRVVLAESRRDGFRYAIPRGSTVLMGVRRRFWRTAEERLARRLAAEGHTVTLIYVE